MEVSINMTDKKIEKGHVNKKKIEKEIVKKKKPFLKIILSIILIPVIGGGIYFVYKGYVAGKEIGFKFSASELIQKKKDPELKKR